tara:strand:- start:816 stop:1397 length:582 start_codon:yes stop_codon:yes gene_type:complete
MRTTIKKTMVLVLIFVTFISSAIENSKSNKLVSVKRVIVEFNNVKKGQTFIIRNENKIIVHKQKIVKPGTFSKVFDLTNLKDGIYTSEVEKDFEISIKKFSVSNGYVTFIKEESKKIFKPLIRLKGDLLLISKVSFKEPLNIVLYYEENTIVDEQFEGKDIINRIYKLSKAKKGAYRIVVNSDNRLFTKNFTI